MEKAQEREVQLLQGRQAWPFHTMGMGMGMAAAAGGCFDGYNGGGGGGDCFVLGWEQPPAAAFGCFGLLAADVHDLFPLFAGMESPLPVVPSSALAAAPPAPAHDAVPGDLDDLLLNFWDASCHDGDVGEGEQRHDDAFNSSCITREQATTTCAAAAAAATATNSIHYDDGDDPLSSIFCTGPTPLPAEKAVAFQPPAAEPLLSSSSSNSNCPGATATPGASRARTPPLPWSSASTPSLKRATRVAAESSPDQAAAAERGQSESSKRRRTAEPAAAAPVGLLCPFALLKPDGLDGGATLADINARLLMRPARPVRHPVGEFACAPRVSADQPGISGKAVSSFTRLHTPGRGTITIIRTRG
ncbi:uncharacterized protein C2845_PM03G36390 [Panicum miliaceum]|uniref:Protein XRI1-like n=1 Tax=Panicum miliaceum TaxID=4540 RepID=A0A3L6TBW7_PANMI|nr:uncharacterized protein C2845_PM03G36390 [Panicum miliaceum]